MIVAPAQCTVRCLRSPLCNKSFSKNHVTITVKLLMGQGIMPFIFTLYLFSIILVLLLFWACFLRYGYRFSACWVGRWRTAKIWISRARRPWVFWVYWLEKCLHIFNCTTWRFDSTKYKLNHIALLPCKCRICSFCRNLVSRSLWRANSKKP